MITVEKQVDAAFVALEVFLSSVRPESSQQAALVLCSFCAATAAYAAEFLDAPTVATQLRQMADCVEAATAAPPLPH